MDRRMFLTGGAVATALFGSIDSVSLVRAASSRPGLTVLRIGFVEGRASLGGLMASTIAQGVSERCGGRVRVDLYPSGEAGGELAATQDVAVGALDMVIASSAGYAIAAPKLGIFDVPFLFRDVRHARAVLDGPIGQASLDDLKPAGLVGLAWGENGVRHLTTTDRPVRSPENLAGLKIRVPETEVMLAGFKALGADPKPLAFADLYSALADGTFQAQENPVSNIRSAGFDRVQKYLCLTAHVYSPFLIMIGRRAFDALQPAHRDALRFGALQAARLSREASDAAEKSAIEELRGRGMTVIDDVDRNAFAAQAAKGESDFEKLFEKRRLDAIRTFGS